MTKIKIARFILLLLSPSPHRAAAPGPSPLRPNRGAVLSLFCRRATSGAGGAGGRVLPVVWDGGGIERGLSKSPAA